MILSYGRKTVSLNGLWNFSVDLYHTCIRKRFFEEKYDDEDHQRLPVDFDFEQWEKGTVPFCLNTFDRAFFWYECKVFLNGAFIGYHVGGYTPFYVEVTDFLKKDNRLLLIANNERKLEGIPSINTD